MSVQISRMLAAKAALAIRYDALGEDTNAEMGVENRAKLEARLRQLEEKGVSATTAAILLCCWLNRSAFKYLMFLFFSDPKSQWNRQSNGKGRQIPAQEVNSRKPLLSRVYIFPRVCMKGVKYPLLLLLHSEVRIYDPSGDSTIPSTSKKRKFEEVKEEEESAEEPETPVVKSKKARKEAAAAEGGWDGSKPDLVAKCPQWSQ